MYSIELRSNVSGSGFRVETNQITLPQDPVHSLNVLSFHFRFPFLSGADGIPKNAVIALRALCKLIQLARLHCKRTCLDKVGCLAVPGET